MRGGDVSSTMQFKHFIITRFNVNIEPVEFAPRLQKPWLSLRFELFQRFCFPSVRSQSEQNFTWLVLFDEQTPDMFRRLIASYAGYANFIPIYCGNHASILPAVIAEMQRRAADVPWLLSTRLDNDDALGVRFVEAVQQAAGAFLERGVTPGRRYFFNFTRGLQICGDDLYDFRDPCNAFVTLLEERGGAESVFCVDHPAISGKGAVVQVDASPLWLQNVHGTNVYNYVRGERIGIVQDLQGFVLG